MNKFEKKIMDQSRESYKWRECNDENIAKCMNYKLRMAKWKSEEFKFWKNQKYCGSETVK